MGTRQNEPPVASVLVYDSLQIGKKLRRSLHFVNYSAIDQGRQESPRVREGNFPDVWFFQRNILLVWKCILSKRSLTGLARPGDGHNRKVFRKFETYFVGRPRNNFVHISD